MSLSLSSGVCIVADITLLLVNCFLIDVVHLLQLIMGVFTVQRYCYQRQVAKYQIITEIGERAFLCN